MKVYNANEVVIQLAMGVLGSTFAGAFLSTRGGSKEQQQKQQGPPVQAGSKDEEDFIQCVPFNPGQTTQMLIQHRKFLQSADGGDQKAQH